MARCGGSGDGPSGSGVRRSRGGGSRWWMIIGIIVIIGLLLYWFGSSGCPGSGPKGSCPAAACGNDMADKTGLPDIALESLGGRVLSIGDTRPVPAKVRISIFGLPILSEPSPPPETIIRYGVEPGKCWSFQGSSGNVTLQLMKPAVITGIHLEHIHKALDPYGILGSAPKEFQIWGIRNFYCSHLGKRYLLGNFTFTPTVKPLQYFEVKEYRDQEFGQIQLEVLSNHGDNYTCIYRIRVHGDINATKTGGGAKADDNSCH